MDNQPRDPNHWRNKIEQEQQQKQAEAEKSANTPNQSHAERIRAEMPHNLRSEHTSYVDYVQNRDKPKQPEQAQPQQGQEAGGTRFMSQQQEQNLNNAKENASVFDRYGASGQHHTEKNKEQEKTKGHDREQER